MCIRDRSSDGKRAFFLNLNAIISPLLMFKHMNFISSQVEVLERELTKIKYALIA